MSDPNASTLSAFVDSAKSTAASVVGAITGNPADKQQAEDKQADAEAKSTLSNTAAKVGPYTATADGGVAKDDSRRTEGSWNQTIGSGKEMVGGLVGSDSLKHAGEEQNRLGKEQEAKGQLSDLGTGMVDRARGAVGAAAASAMGDEKVQQAYQDVHDQGKAQQRGAEVDLQKQAEAEQK